MRTTATTFMFLGAGLLACADGAPYATPGPNTAPAIELALPEVAKRYVDSEFWVAPTFGVGSADLSMVVISQVGEPTRRLDFSYPGRQTLVGYGSLAGLQETYRRTRMVDANGIHGTRTAVYRNDLQGNHTNVWYHHWAKATNGTIYLTQMSRWDWQGGDIDVVDVPLAAWQIFQNVAITGFFGDSFFGLHPGIWDLENNMRQEFLSTNVRSPTTGIENCVLYYQNAVQDERRYLAYLHEDLGIVEMVYSWESGPEGGVASVLPLGGFALLSGSVEDQRRLPQADSVLKGQWEGSFAPRQVVKGAEEEAVQGELSEPFTLDLAIDAAGLNYEPEVGLYQIHGTYDDPFTKTVHMHGYFHEKEAQTDTGESVMSGYFELVSGSEVEPGAGSGHLIDIEGRYVAPNTMMVTARILRRRTDDFYVVKGSGTLVRR